MQLSDSVGKLLYTEQVECDLTVLWSYERNAFADEGWHYRDDELIDGVRVQYLASAHQPDVPARFRAQAFEKSPFGSGGTVHVRRATVLRGGMRCASHVAVACRPSLCRVGGTLHVRTSKVIYCGRILRVVTV